MAQEQQGGERQRRGWRRGKQGEAGRAGQGDGMTAGAAAGMAAGTVGRGRRRGEHRPVGNKLRLGKPQVKPSTPSHVPGVREGNSPGHYKMQPGHLEDGTSTARRSTGINAKHRNPIDPSAPNLSPP